MPAVLLCPFSPATARRGPNPRTLPNARGAGRPDAAERAQGARRCFTAQRRQESAWEAHQTSSPRPTMLTSQAGFQSGLCQQPAAPRPPQAQKKSLPSKRARAEANLKPGGWRQDIDTARMLEREGNITEGNARKLDDLHSVGLVKFLGPNSRP